MLLRSTSEPSSKEDLPCLSLLKSSKAVQKKVDARLAELESTSHVEGNECVRLKSKRGGGVDVLVSKKVAWPQDSFFWRGVTKKRIYYDQLLLTQFVQGFAQDILEELSLKNRKAMYLNDLMEDAFDFSWANTKASHTVLLCEMETDMVSWQDTQRIDRIRRAHAQKHSSTQNWANTSKVCAPTQEIMNQGVNCKGICAHSVLAKVVTCLTQKKTVIFTKNLRQKLRVLLLVLTRHEIKL